MPPRSLLFFLHHFSIWILCWFILKFCIKYNISHLWFFKIWIFSWLCYFPKSSIFSELSNTYVKKENHPPKYEKNYSTWLDLTWLELTSVSARGLHFNIDTTTTSLLTSSNNNKLALTSKQLEILERKGMVSPSEPYVSGVFGRKCTTDLDFKKRFKQLHQKERQKKLNRMASLKGEKMAAI